jgi:heme exporter protein C
MRVLGWLAVLGVAVGFAAGLAWAPREATQGEVQRIMYVHVPAVWVAYLAFGVVFVASVAYLWQRGAAADRLAHAAAEAGTLFLGLNIATGAIWGKPTWGTWWTWDARLTSVSIVFVMFVGYLLLRRAVDDPERGARYAAVIGIVAALNIPLVHFSVVWWRTLHQPPSLMKAGGATMPRAIVIALLINFVGFALTGAWFIAKRWRLLRAEAEAIA